MESGFVPSPDHVITTRSFAALALAVSPDDGVTLVLAALDEHDVIIGALSVVEGISASRQSLELATTVAVHGLLVDHAVPPHRIAHAVVDPGDGHLTVESSLVTVPFEGPEG